MVASLHRIEHHLTGSCPDPDLEPLSLEPLIDLLRIRRSPEERANEMTAAVRRALIGS